ncbi:MAG: hypothetical protein ACRENE_08990 [Polyangiaceae bacterium]
MENSNSPPGSSQSAHVRRAGERQSYFLLVLGFLIAAAMPYLIHPSAGPASVPHAIATP